VANPSAAEIAADARTLLEAGRSDEAISACLRALEVEPDCLDAHVCLARAKRPGDDYLVWLRRLHERLRPRTYLEIGVDAGRTLRLAQPPTRAIGVDPVAQQGTAFSAETRLFAMESDAFFASAEAARELSGRTIDLAFVDGLHLFEQALRDFMHIERRAERTSVVLFHDCLPLTRSTASRTRATGFWTGDVWKIVPILTAHRPDLDVFIIPAYPTGLAVVTRLDPASRALDERYASLVSRFREAEWDEKTEAGAPIVTNDEDSVVARIGRGR